MKRDALTHDLFEVPEVFVPRDGNWNFALEVSHLVSEELKRSPHDRFEVSARMSRMSGDDISKGSLDAWASPARVDHNIPFYRIPLIEEVLATHGFTDWLVSKRGGKAAYGKDALQAELGKMTVMKEAMDRQIRELKRHMEELS